MIGYKIILGYIAVATALIAYGIYLYSATKGKTKPHAFSWLLWGLLTGIIFAAQILKGGGAGSWVTGVSSVICFAIGFLALFKDDRNFSPFDWTFLGAALVALLIWIFSKNPVLSVCLVTLVDVLGYGSTIRKAYHKPGEEKALSFALNSLKFVFALFALQTYSLVTWLYPVAMIIMNGFVAALVTIRKRIKSLGAW